MLRYGLLRNDDGCELSIGCMLPNETALVVLLLGRVVSLCFIPGRDAGKCFRWNFRAS